MKKVSGLVAAVVLAFAGTTVVATLALAGPAVVAADEVVVQPAGNCGSCV